MTTTLWLITYGLFAISAGALLGISIAFAFGG